MNEIQFEKVDWPLITLQLVKYAVYKVRRLEWRTGSFLPRGLLPEDLALDAIRKTIEGIRAWDSAKQPDLLNHLKGVVDSDGRAVIGAEEVLLKKEAGMENERRFKKLMNELYLLCVDDEEELLVLLAYQEAAKRHDKVKPALVAKYSGLDEKTTRNAMRSLLRKVERRRCYD